ncbi:MAG: hypothetical protein ABI662_10635, partial [Dermatophilaceae bacterium]
MLGTDGKLSSTPSESTNHPSESTQNLPETAHPKAESAKLAVPISVRKASTQGSERWAYGWFDRRLKVMSVLLPVAFILFLELLHYRIEERDQHLNGYWDGYHAVFVAITVVSIVLFGLVMFRFIDRAQRQVVR